MIVVVTYTYSRKKRTFKGTPEQVLNQLLLQYPWAARSRGPNMKHDPAKLSDVLSRLNGAEALMVEVEDA